MPGDVIPPDGLFHGFTGVMFAVLQALHLHDVRESSLSDLPDDSVIYTHRVHTHETRAAATNSMNESYCSFLRR